MKVTKIEYDGTIDEAVDGVNTLSFTPNVGPPLLYAMAGSRSARRRRRRVQERVEGRRQGEPRHDRADQAGLAAGASRDDGEDLGGAQRGAGLRWDDFGVLFFTDDDKMVARSVFKDMDSLKGSSEAQARVMGGFKEHMAGPPTPLMGNLFWTLKGNAAPVAKPATRVTIVPLKPGSQEAVKGGLGKVLRS